LNSKKVSSIYQQSHKTEEHMILATIRMAIPPQKRDEALKILTTMAEQWRDEPGCLSCSIYRDLEEKNVLMLEEVWRSQEDLDLHLRTDEYRNLLLVLEMALKQPQIRFDTISSSAGIEAIEKARNRVR
jgi:quinol monooxygenase YgiN